MATTAGNTAPRASTRASARMSRLRRHLLLASLRPRHAARGDHGRTRLRRCEPVRRCTPDLSLTSGEHARGGCDPPGSRTPLLIHQPSYSMLNRWIEPSCSTRSGVLGVGCIACSPPRAGNADEKVSGRDPRRLQRARAARARRSARTRDGTRALAKRSRQRSTTSQAVAVRRWRRWRLPGCSVTLA